MATPQIGKLLPIIATAPVAVGARPVNANSGVDITAWGASTGGYMPRVAAVKIVDPTAVGAETIQPLAGAAGVEVWGLVNGDWCLIGYLNNEVAVPITSAILGFAQQLNDLEACTRLLIAGTPSVGAPTYSFIPMETYR